MIGLRTTQVGSRDNDVLSLLSPLSLLSLLPLLSLLSLLSLFTLVTLVYTESVKGLEGSRVWWCSFWCTYDTSSTGLISDYHGFNLTRYVFCIIIMSDHFSFVGLMELQGTESSRMASPLIHLSFDSPSRTLDMKIPWTWFGSCKAWDSRLRGVMGLLLLKCFNRWYVTWYSVESTWNGSDTLSDVKCIDTRCSGLVVWLVWL